MSVSRLQNLQGDLLPVAQQYNRTVACTQAYYQAHYLDPKSTSPFPDGCFIVVKDDTQSVMDSFIDQIYPVGSVYMNALVDTNPSILFNHGTWNRITGSFLYAADGTTISALDTGGASTVTLTETNLPSEVTFTIPSLSVTVDSSSTAHTHTTSEVTGNSTGNMSAHSTGTLPETSCTSNFGPLDGTTFTQPADNPKYYRKDLSTLGNASLQTAVGYSMNIEHTHSFTIPALTTGGMSANETHTHTAATVASSETITDLGGDTAFDIIPPYTALNVWYRVS